MLIVKTFSLNFFQYLFLAVLGLCTGHGLFSSCSKQDGGLLILHCGAWASHWGGFSHWGAQALGREPSGEAAGFGAQARLFHGMWILPRSGMESMLPALAVRFLFTVPQGKSQSRKKESPFFLSGSRYDTVWSVLCLWAEETTPKSHICIAMSRDKLATTSSFQGTMEKKSEIDLLSKDSDLATWIMTDTYIFLVQCCSLEICCVLHK